MVELEQMARRLNKHLRRTGVVAIRRTGAKKSDELAEWAFNLLDTYRKSPQGRRAEWVRQNLPELHEAMLRWAGEPGASEALVASRRFEVQAAMAFGFMVRMKRAPKQTASCTEEARMAKWLSRRRPGLGRSSNSAPESSDVLRLLQEMCCDLRSQRSAPTLSDPLFGMIGTLWLGRPRVSEAEASRIRSCIAGNEPFWSWPDWMTRLWAEEQLRRAATERTS